MALCAGDLGIDEAFIVLSLLTLAVSERVGLTLLESSIIISTCAGIEGLSTALPFPFTSVLHSAWLLSNIGSAEASLK
jgi:hypothetical protein